MPSYGGPAFERDGRVKEVVGIAFPPNVVQVRLDLQELGERVLPLQLLTRRQAKEAHVEQLRWGYLKVVEKMPVCLQEVTGYDAQEQAVYRAIAGPAARCQPEPTIGG